MSLIRTLSCLIFCLSAVIAADPRPLIVVLGDRHAADGADPAWPTLIAQQRPQWRVRRVGATQVVLGTDLVQTGTDRKGNPTETVHAGSLPQLQAALDGVAAAGDQVRLLVLAVGSDQARAAIVADRDLAAAEAGLRATIALAQSHPATAGAQVALMTPLPVVEARLDRWSTSAFAGGEAVSLALAERMRAVAAETACALIDFQAWALADADAQGPGRLVGSIGWAMRAWGQRDAATWMLSEFERLDPQPVDAAAFAAWQAEQAAHRALDLALAASSEGLPAIGPAIVGSEGLAGRERTITFTIPPTSLVDGYVSLLVAAAPGVEISSMAGGNASERKHVPKLLFPGTGAEHEIFALPMHSRLIDEALPDEVIPGDRYGINQGKWRPWPLVDGRPGQRRWLLLRFDCGDVVASGPMRVVMCLGGAGNLEVLGPQGPSGRASGTLGLPVIHELLGADRVWSPLAATWRHRDGQELGWTGGSIDAAARRQALAPFLTADTPDAVRARAEAALAELPGHAP